MRLHARRKPDGLAPGGCDAQVHRLDQGVRPVIERRIGDGQSGQAGHHGLEFEDRLEDALRHFRLIRRVGGHELGAPGQRPHDRRHLVVVGPTTGEAHQAIGPGPVGGTQ